MMGGRMGAILVGAMLIAGIGPVDAARASSTVPVPCRVGALRLAMSRASSGERLSLAPNCTYVLARGLPTVTSDLTVLGNGATLERSYAAGTPAFTILESQCCGALTVENLNFRHGDNAITVDGGSLTVTGGTFTGNTGADGGAISDPSTGLNGPIVSDAAFIANRATEFGGAIYNNSALDGVSVTNCEFSGNLAASAGGAIYDFAVGNDTISGSMFRGNSAAAAGALFLDPLSGSLSNDVIEGNTSTSTAGGVYGVFDLRIDNSKIIGNQAGGEGGGLYADFQGFSDSISGTTFYGNSASDGGAIYNTLQGVGVGLTNVIISGNRASAHGGGIYNQGAVGALRTQIFGNTAMSGGGGIYDDDSQFGGTTTLTKSIVRVNEPDNCEPARSITGCAG